MTDFVCPEEIQEKFEANPDVGRKAIIAWLKTVEMHVGDRVWLPEGGWFDKIEERQQ